jgi:hypothetical protein
MEWMEGKQGGEKPLCQRAAVISFRTTNSNSVFAMNNSRRIERVSLSWRSLCRLSRVVQLLFYGDLACSTGLLIASLPA